jgi:hypothetical protein
LKQQRIAARLSLFGSLTRVFGGAVLLVLVGSPTWFWSAWIMAGVRIGIGRRP